MGFKVSNPIKRTVIGTEEVYMGPIDEPKAIISTNEMMNFAVIYHNGPSCGMNTRYNKLEDALKKYYSMVTALSNGASFEELYAVLSKKVD